MNIYKNVAWHDFLTMIQMKFCASNKLLTDCASSWGLKGLFGRYVWFCRLAHNQNRWKCTGIPNSLATSSCKPYCCWISYHREIQTVIYTYHHTMNLLKCISDHPQELTRNKVSHMIQKSEENTITYVGHHWE